MKTYLRIILMFSLLAFSVTAALAAPHSVTTWRGNHPGALSLTFDDGYISQYTSAVPALNARGLRGTFFIITSFPGDCVTWDNLRTMASMGHEIGSHTITHPDLATLSSSAAENEISASQAAINAQIPGQKCVTFAYPFGSYNSSVEALVKKYYLAARGVAGTLNDASTDPFGEGGYDVSTYTVWEMEGLADQAAAQGKWLIPSFHSFNPDNWGTWTFDQFSSYMDYLVGKNALWIAPFGEVFKYQKERGAATLALNSQTGSQITLNLTDTLDDTVYNYPLTLRSEVPVNWSSVTMQQGSAVSILTPVVEGSAWVVYYDAVPDKGAITLTWAVSNQPPVANNDAYQTGVNSALTVAAPGVLGNDTDPQGAKLTAQLVSGPSHGTLTLNANNSFTYTPALNYTGSDGFSYKASNGPLSSATASAAITVQPLPPAPLNDSYGTVKNTSLSVAAPGVLGNDSDPQGLPLTARLAGGPSHGTLSLNGNGSFSYVPAANYTGSDSFSYTAGDGTLTSAAATVSISVNASLALSALTLNNDSDIGGATFLGTVSLDGPAPGGGVTVSLGDNSSSSSLPASVTVPAGSTSASFGISSLAVASSTAVTISSLYGGVTKTATLTLLPPDLSTFTLNPSTLTGGASAQGTLTLDGPAPTGGIVVTLSDDSSAAAEPASVTVPAGASSASFTVSTSSVASISAAALSAVHGGTTKFAMLTINPAAALSALAVSPASVTGGVASLGTLTLSGPAPAGGVAVSLSSNSPAAAVAPSVTVAGGSSSATFAISTTPVAAASAATISALYGGVTRTAALTVTPPVLSSLSLSPASVAGGAASLGTLTLGSPAPAAGLVVPLSSNSSAAAVPASVTVAGGASAAGFSISTTPVTKSSTATISALLGGVTKTAALTVTPPALSALSLAPASVAGGVSSLGTVTLSGPAPTGGALVTLSDNSSAASEPASVTVAAGSSSASFTISTSTVTSSTTATISAVYGGVTKTAGLTVTPSGASPISGTITPAPSGAGATLTLSQGATTVATVTAASDGSFSFPSAANGAYTVTPAKAGFSFTPASAPVTVSGPVSGVNFSAAGLAVDVTSSADLIATGTALATPAFSTRAGNELLLAFVSTDATGDTPNITVTGVSGGGLTWTLVQRANGQPGTAEIWRAFASAPLTNVTVSAGLSQSIAASSLTVMSFAGVNPATPVGATGAGSASSGAPTASLTTRGANSWVFAVGSDWYGHVARTPGAGQSVVHQYLPYSASPEVYDSFWVQRQNATSQSAGTSVTINDTAPVSDGWNLSLVEILQ